MIQENTLKQFLLVSIIPQKMDEEDLLKDLEELKSLVEVFGGQVVDLMVQRREETDRGMYIGRGKIEETKQLIEKKDIDVVVLNANVKPGQLFDLKNIFWKVNETIDVWDRVDLILQIFALHAKTSEAKLQIELASMRHMGPRIYGMGMVMSRQGGGIGVRGVGETNTELMRRHWRDQIKKIQEKLEKLARERERQMERRRDIGLSTVSIIGYTNAGKSSLFNLLSGKKKLVENALFATLDSNVGKLYLPNLKKEILVSDTIGFIQNLPTKLIDAFKSTLMESVNADVLIHLIDAADPDMKRKIKVVDDILRDLGIHSKKTVYVFNKMDAAKDLAKNELEEKYRYFHPQFISVKENKGIEALIKEIEEQLSAETVSTAPDSSFSA